MFFDEITLSKKSWHYKLQSLIFGDPPFKNNFCPYFWLTIFCLMISPFVGLFMGGKFFISFLDKLLSPIPDFIQENVCEPFLNKAYRALSDDKIYYLFDKAYEYSIGYGSYKKNRKCSKEFDIWKKAMGETWEEYLAGVKERVQKRKEEEGKRQAEYEKELKRKKEEKLRKEQLRRKMFSRIAQYTKWVAIPIVLVVAIAGFSAILYFLGWLCASTVKFLFSFWTWKLTGIIFAIFLILLGAIGIAFLLAKLGKKLKACLSLLFIPEPKPFKPKKLKKAFHLEDKIFSVLEKLILPFQIFIDYVKVFKQNNCPAIIWKEEKEK